MTVNFLLDVSLRIRLYANSYYLVRINSSILWEEIVLTIVFPARRSFTDHLQVANSFCRLRSDLVVSNSSNDNHWEGMAEGAEKRDVKNETDTETRNSEVDFDDLSRLQGVNIYRGRNFLETLRDYCELPTRMTRLNETQWKKNNWQWNPPEISRLTCIQLCRKYWCFFFYAISKILFRDKSIKKYVPSLAFSIS